MNTSYLTTVAPLAGSPLTRRGLLRAGLGGAALWACRPRSSAAIRIPPARATTDFETLLLLDRSHACPDPGDTAIAAARRARPGPGACRDGRGIALSDPGNIRRHHRRRLDCAASATSRRRRAGSRRWSTRPSAPVHGSEFARSHASQVGLAAGREIGQAVVAWGQADGSDATWDGRRPTGAWHLGNRPRPSYRQNPVEPLAGTWRPWVLPSGDALRPAPPPSWGHPPGRPS